MNARNVKQVPTHLGPCHRSLFGISATWCVWLNDCSVTFHKVRHEHTSISPLLVLWKQPIDEEFS